VLDSVASVGEYVGFRVLCIDEFCFDAGVELVSSSCADECVSGFLALCCVEFAFESYVYRVGAVVVVVFDVFPFYL
jgi:hypothetical protein